MIYRMFYIHVKDEGRNALIHVLLFIVMYFVYPISGNLTEPKIEITWDQH